MSHWPDWSHGHPTCKVAWENEGKTHIRLRPRTNFISEKPSFSPNALHSLNFPLASTLLQLFLFSCNKGSISKGKGSQLTPDPAYGNSLQLHPAHRFLLALFINISFFLFLLNFPQTFQNSAFQSCHPGAEGWGVCFCLRIQPTAKKPEAKS